MPDFYAKLNITGLNKVAGFATGGAIVDITQIAVGDGNGAYYDPTGDETILVNEVHRRAISKVYKHPNHANWIVAEAIISATVGGFNIREVMLIDSTGAGIAIAKYPLTELPVPGSGSTKDVYIRIIFHVANASAVVQSIDPSLIMATQQYVNNRMPRVVRVAATGNIDPAGLQTIDGIELVENDLVLLPLQGVATENGIYVVSTVQTGSWVRALDADDSLEVTASMMIIVPEGTVNADTIWMLTTNAPITLGTTPLTFIRILPDERQRTIADTAAPTGDTAAPTTLWGWLAYMIKAITGKANWRTAPAITLEAAKTALDTKAPLASPALTGVPSAPTSAPGTNTTQISTTAFVQAAITALIDSSPAAMNTLNEFAVALGNDPNFATTITNALAAKQPLITPGTVAQFWRGDKTWQAMPTTLPASDVYAWAKSSVRPSYSKGDVGMGSADNTADSAKSVNYANSAGTAGSAPANDVYAWAKQPTKPGYSAAEVGAAPTSHAHSYAPMSAFMAASAYETSYGNESWKYIRFTRADGSIFDLMTDHFVPSV